ncbi:MAG: DNA primase [Candidimonas sp.]|nr:MAG: DNA primase [Candidimonas sp.]
MIPDAFVQDLLARVDISDVVGRYVPLRKAGANLLGLCPFHNEKTPSFTVSPTKQFYHCFGCGAHGSAISFLMEHTGASFPEAVKALAATVGMAVPEESRSPRQQAAARERKEQKSHHRQVLEQAQACFVGRLKTSPSAIGYLKRRGISGQTAARFGLGWAGTDRHGLAEVFPNYEDPVLVESGLVIESDDGRRYDRFRERIMFPIHDGRGGLIGFGGRVLDKSEPKYLNSPETTLFSKGQELYGLWEARAAIRANGHVLVVEGYMDVVSLAHSGVENAVATLGTATTAMHVQKLLRTSDHIVFSFDGDQAGRRAAWRALQQCLPLLRDDVSVRFLFLPAEHDPDSYVRAYGQEAFRATVNEAVPLSRFLLDELASRHAMGEAEGRAACVHEAKPLLAQLPSGALRLQIEREFARQVRFTPEELSAMLADDAVGGSPPAMPASLDDGRTQRPRGTVGGGEAPVGGPTASADSPGEPPFVQYAGRARRVVATRRVTPMAKRLLRLLAAHPELAAALGDQQLEIVCGSPHLVLVRELIALINGSGARHVGALLQIVEAGSDLATVLSSLSAELLGQDDLPDPNAEWRDALARIELDAVKEEQSRLVETGLNDADARQRYRELTRRIALLTSALPRS